MTLKVTLRRDWNGPDDRLYFARNSPLEIDDELLGHLPSTAVIAGKTLRETRKLVLAERKAKGLDKPNPRRDVYDLDDDEEDEAAGN